MMFVRKDGFRKGKKKQGEKKTKKKNEKKEKTFQGARVRSFDVLG